MAVKIRLQRKGRKKAPFYYIVVADSRSPRDGKFIERLGSYNPIPHIPQIDIDTDKTVSWLNQGAIPTKTVKSLLSAKGVLYRRHLLRGVKLGLFSMEDADVKFSEYIAQKSQDEVSILQKMEDKKLKAIKQALEKEVEVNKKRAEQIMAKRKAAIAANAPKVEEVVEEEPAAEAVEETTPEVVEEITPEVVESMEETSPEENTETPEVEENKE